MYQLQTSVIVQDREFHITNNGDFRMILDCFKALTDNELSEDLRVLASLLIFYNEFDEIEDITACNDILEDLITEMYKFFNMGRDESLGIKTNYTLIDWEGDEQLVCSAVNKVAGYEIRSLPYVHWWTFLGYYMAIGDSVMATVVGIRDKIVKHKKLEKWEQEYKRNNPELFTWRRSLMLDDSEAILKEIWNKGGAE